MSDIELVTQPITLSHLETIARNLFGDMVKAVVDVEKEIMAIGGELHADEEAVLLDHGSLQENLWGINIYPGQPRDAWLEYDSMINIRPRQGNRSRTIEDEKIRHTIQIIIQKLVI